MRMICARLHEYLNELLWQRPGLLKDAYKRAIATKAIVYAAEELPATLESDCILETSKFNVYGKYPPMGSWECHSPSIWMMITQATSSGGI